MTGKNFDTFSYKQEKKGERKQDKLTERRKKSK